MTFLKRSLFSQIILGLVLGVLLGLFFGDSIEVLKPLGDAFILFLQVPVLAFVFCAIVTGIASLPQATAKKVLKFASIFLSISWAFCYLVAFSLPMAFPKLTGPQPFASLTEGDASQIGFLGTFIPSNPFYSFSNGFVPAIVVFAFLFAFGLMSYEKKDALLEALTAAKFASIKITDWVIKLSPVGVFALSANVAGTLTFAQFNQLQYFFLNSIFGAFLITFVALPCIASAFSDVPVKKLINALKPALLLALSTGSSLMVLPLIEKHLKELSPSSDKSGDSKTNLYAILIPLLYTFPLSSVLFLVISFVLFSGWFYNTPLDHLQILTLGLSTPFSAFAGTNIAIPNQLSAVQLPLDSYALYPPSIVLLGRLSALMSTMNIAVVSLLTVLTLNFGKTFRPSKLLYGAASIVLLLGMYIGAVNYMVPSIKTESPIFSAHAIQDPVTSQVFNSTQQATPSSLKAIRKSGKLRVGYSPGVRPFSYLNARGQLVGLDIELAHSLAKTLDLSIDFIPFNFSTLATQINRGDFDIAMSAVSFESSRVKNLLFGNPYLEAESVFVCLDHDKETMAKEKTLQSMDNLRIAYLQGSVFKESLEFRYPDATLVPVNSYDGFPDSGIADLLVLNEHSAKNLVLRNPKLAFFEPTPSLPGSAFAYVFANENFALRLQVNEWLTLLQADDSFEESYRYWVEGEQIGAEAGRWSIYKDVLGFK